MQWQIKGMYVCTNTANARVLNCDILLCGSTYNSMLASYMVLCKALLCLVSIPIAHPQAKLDFLKVIK